METEERDSRLLLRNSEFYFAVVVKCLKPTRSALQTTKAVECLSSRNVLTEGATRREASSAPIQKKVDPVA